MLLILGLLFIVSLVLTRLWILLSSKRLWLDHPNIRSSHLLPTPTSGGIGFCLSFLAAVLYLVLSLDQPGTLWALAFSGGMLAILGLADDFWNLAIFPRLSAHIFCVLFSVIALSPFPPLLLGSWLIDSRVVIGAGIVFLGVWQINYFNFMDGIDGLAASEAIFVLICLAAFFAYNGEPVFAFLCLALSSTVLGFVFFNIPVARVFMGDIGSNFLGFSLFFLGMLACVTQCLNYWTFLILMSTFFVDSAATLAARLLSGGLWYHGHRTHAYQLLADKLNSHVKVVILYSMVNCLWLLPLAYLSSLNEALAVYYTLLAWLPLTAIVLFTRKMLSNTRAIPVVEKY